MEIDQTHMVQNFQSLQWMNVRLWILSLGLLAIGGMINDSRVRLAADEGFIEDADKAVQMAKQQKKDLLILFTGSDWCPPCIKLEKEVFSKDAFIDEATRDFVLLKLDYPRRKDQEESLKEQNQNWANQFGVESFPTVIMADAQLLPFKFSGYEEGGPENYLQILNSAKALRQFRDEKFALADKAEGDAKAKLIDEALSEIGEEIVGVYYTEWVEKLVAIDSDNHLGLREKWNGAADSEMRKVVITDLLMVSRIGKPEQAIQLIDQVMNEIAFTNTEKLTILQIKLNLAKNLKTPELVNAVLDQMIQLDGVEGETKHRLMAKKAYLLVGAGKGEQAIQMLDAGLQQDRKACYLYLAKGQLLAAKEQHEEAIKLFDLGLDQLVQNPDLQIEFLSSKADSLFAADKKESAVRILDDFAENEAAPADLRGEALLHKGMLMRAMGRTRQAMLAENRAIAIANSPKDRASVQKIVNQLRKVDRTK